MGTQMSIKEILINKLTEQDKSRPRSVQAQVGVSEIGGCATRVWHKINGTQVTNPDTLRLAAIMGTALHSMIEDVFIPDSRYKVETEVAVGDILGHIDLIDTETNTIWDWKTTTKNSLAYFGSKQQLMQIQLYGWLANQNGIKIERVGLVAIARDGNESDITELSWPYDETMALEAVERYHSIKQQFEPPAPEKDAKFCTNYCPFFGACAGIPEPSPSNIIDSMEIATLAEDYKTIAAQIKDLTAQQDYIKEQLDGTTGTTATGTVIKWSQVAGRQTTDEAEVEKLLGFVPKKQGNGYSRLTIK
jgi:hypothetical protein